jgi:hypothetical protein
METQEVCDDYIETFTGGKFYFGDRMPESDIRIEDIAHALAIEPRFGGHTREPYSVAEHCCHVYDLFCGDSGRRFQGKLLALLHDAHEAYTKDVMKPLRRTPGMEGYNALSRRVQSAIETRYALAATPGEFRDIKLYDLSQLRAEANELMSSKGLDWQWPAELPGVSMAVKLWTWQQSKAEFLRRFTECF